MTQIPDRLQEIIEDFALCQGREKLEYLLEFAENMPPLPEWLHHKRDSMEPVPECMTPIFIHMEVKNGRLTFYFDVPNEAPTVRGYAGVLHQGMHQTTSAQLLATPNDFYRQMGLHTVLTGQRLNGIGAILMHMKKLAQEKAFES